LDRDEGRSRRAATTPAQDEWRVRKMVAAARAGNRDAMRELYESHARDVHAHVLRILGDVHDADDVTQQVFAKLLTGLDRYQPGGAPFSAWVHRVARNAAIDHLRRRNLELCGEVPEARSPDGASADEARTSLRTALESLPPAQRDVVVLMDMIGFSPSEIAERLGKTVRSVHGLHYRGRAAARLALDDLGCAPATMQAMSA
jgi:RNA polymerase sigma-70 factor (ECF subfamily)